MAQDSTLTLTGLRTGFRLESSSSSGLMKTVTHTEAITGYVISTETGKDNVPFTTIGLADKTPLSDPPALELSALYVQSIGYPEVDLDLRYTDIPSGTDVEVVATNAALAIPRQPIKGSSLIGVMDEGGDEISSGLILRVWITDTAALKSSSALSINLSRIEKGKDGSDRKVLLQKLALNLKH